MTESNQDPPGPLDSPGDGSGLSGEKHVADETTTRRIGTASGEVRIRPLARLEVGALVNERYRIEAPLGKGGMATVWLAEDEHEGRKVALKEMLLGDGTAFTNTEAAILFRREFFAMKKLQHPRTVKVYDLGLLEGGGRFLIMEVVDGEDLRTRMLRARMTRDEVTNVLVQLAEVLAFIHARLFVHCDLKPENIRIFDDGEIKLMDYGVIHQLGTPAGDRIGGTPAYMAPEWSAGGIIDGRADLYSLGILAHTLMTGAPPFRGTRAEVLEAHQRATPPPLPELAGTDLDIIVRKLLAKDPRERFREAADLVAALYAARGESPREEPLAARASYLHTPIAVGSKDERKRLHTALEASLRGKAQALLIGAPAGTGKSRLVREFELRVRQADVPFLVGQCRAEGLAPLAPFRQAFRSLPDQDPTVQAIFDTSPLAKKLTARERFDALTKWLRNIADTRPFVVCIEDLHWADASTVEHLNVAIRALLGTRGLVLATFRSDELARSGIAFETVREGNADALELSALTHQDLTELVTLVLPGLDVPTTFSARLHEVTRGNAFFATECLRALVEQGVLHRVSGRWHAKAELTSTPLPRSIPEVVRTRLSTLSPERSAFFSAIAPAGRVLDLELIRSITAMGDAELFDALDDGIERQFLEYAEGRYFFVHDTVRETIYTSTMQSERAAIHLRIADSLVARHGQSIEAARTIGYHFARSSEPTRAIHPLLLAGRHGVSGSALFDGYRSLAEAAALLENHPTFENRQALLTATWAELVEVAYATDTPACGQYANKLFEYWRSTVDVEQGCHQLAEAHAACKTDADRAALSKELPIQTLQTPLDVFRKLAELRMLESAAYAITGQVDKFSALLGQVMSELSPALPQYAAARIGVAGLAVHTGRFQGVIEEMRGYLAVLRRDEAHASRRLVWALGLGAYFLNAVLAMMGLPLDPEAEADVARVADRGFHDLRLFQQVMHVIRAAFIGDGETFFPQHSKLHEAIAALGNPRLPLRNLAILTPVFFLERREVEAAEALVRRAEQLSQVLPGDRWLARYLPVYGSCLAALKGQRNADNALCKALEMAESTDLRMKSIILVHLARHHRAHGERAEAEQYAAAALAWATDPLRRNPFDEILARREVAALHTGTAARDELMLGLDLATTSGNVLQQGILRLALAAPNVTSDASERLQLRNDAEAILERAGAQRWLQILRETAS